MIDVVAMALESDACRARRSVEHHDLAKRAWRASAGRNHRAVGAPGDRAHQVGQVRQRRDGRTGGHRQAVHLFVAGHGQLPAVWPPHQRRHLREHGRRLCQRRHLLVDRNSRRLRVRGASRHPGPQHRDLVGRQVLLRWHLRLCAALDLQDERALVWLARHQRRSRVSAAHQILMAFEEQAAFHFRGVVAAQAVGFENRHHVSSEVWCRFAPHPSTSALQHRSRRRRLRRNRRHEGGHADSDNQEATHGHRLVSKEELGRREHGPRQVFEASPTSGRIGGAVVGQSGQNAVAFAGGRRAAERRPVEFGQRLVV